VERPHAAIVPSASSALLLLLRSGLLSAVNPALKYLHLIGGPGTVSQIVAALKDKGHCGV
jgi:hypothetical protein